MYSGVEQGTLRLSSECCGCIWPAWMGSYWPFIIFYCRGESHCEWDHGSRPCLCFLHRCLNSTSDDRRARVVTVEHLLKCSVTEQLMKAPLSHNSGWRQKQLISNSTNSSQMLCFVLISSWCAAVALVAVNNHSLWESVKIQQLCKYLKTDPRVHTDVESTAGTWSVMLLLAQINVIFNSS